RAQKQEALQQLQRMAEALALARRLIAELNQEVSRSWQRELKMKLEELMPRLLPHYVEPGVLENLELTLRDGKTGKVFQGSKELGYLSRGTRDQLDFILRVAIGEILTTHCGPLPLILDEPFAHWDDERFVQGVRFLTDLAERRQVIVLTCHSWRFDRLREEYPGIYAQLAFVEIG
ncbi:MAG: ATP-binding protein, partial [Candidatus Sumerlaeaceae bacterium]